MDLLFCVLLLRLKCTFGLPIIPVVDDVGPPIVETLVGEQSQAQPVQRGLHMRMEAKVTPDGAILQDVGSRSSRDYPYAHDDNRRRRSLYTVPTAQHEQSRGPLQAQPSGSYSNYGKQRSHGYGPRRQRVETTETPAPTPTATKKKKGTNSFVGFATIGAAIAVIGVAAFYGYKWWQDKNAHEGYHRYKVVYHEDMFDPDRATARKPKTSRACVHMYASTSARDAIDHLHDGYSRTVPPDMARNTTVSNIYGDTLDTGSALRVQDLHYRSAQGSTQPVLHVFVGFRFSSEAVPGGEPLQVHCVLSGNAGTRVTMNVNTNTVVLGLKRAVAQQLQMPAQEVIERPLMFQTKDSQMVEMEFFRTLGSYVIESNTVLFFESAGKLIADNNMVSF